MTGEAIMLEWLRRYDERPDEQRTPEDDQTADDVRRFFQIRRRATTHDGSDEGRAKAFGFPWTRPDDLSCFVATSNGYVTCPTEGITKLINALPDVYAELARLYERHGELATGQLLVRSGYLTQNEAELEDEEMEK